MRVPGMRAVAEADFARAEAKFEVLLGSDAYFCGSSFTLADVFAADIARWAEQAKITLTSDVLKTYADRMAQRPAWKRAMEAMT